MGCNCSSYYSSRSSIINDGLHFLLYNNDTSAKLFTLPDARSQRQGAVLCPKRHMRWDAIILRPERPGAILLPSGIRTPLLSPVWRRGAIIVPYGVRTLFIIVHWTSGCYYCPHQRQDAVIIVHLTSGRCYYCPFDVRMLLLSPPASGRCYHCPFHVRTLLLSPMASGRYYCPYLRHDA